MCKGHRFIVDNGAPFHNHVDHTAKLALKMLWFVRYNTCYSFTVDCPIIVNCAPALSKLECVSFVTASFAVCIF